MKLDDLFEIASSGVTSVQSIGKVEYSAFGKALIKLYRRDDSNVPKCIADIKRKTGCGWAMSTTDGWKDVGLPHFGNLSNIKTPVYGTKTIRKNLKAMLKSWGVNYDDLIKKED